MTNSATHDAWQAGEYYEIYMGRWSSLIAGRFIPWLDVSSGLDWLDIGCGIGALSRTILEGTNPASVVGVEPSEGFVAHARALTILQSRFWIRANFAGNPVSGCLV